jgi:Flp pilus assembly protein TadB
VKAFDVGLLLVGVALLVVILATHFQSLWLAFLALAARAGVALWAFAKRRRQDAT